MKKLNLRKKLFSFGLFIMMALPTVIFVGAGNVAKAQGRTATLREYVNKFNNYAKDCDSIKDQARPNAQQLKRCLTVAKDLRDKFAEFLADSDRFVQLVKNRNKWNAELDKLFYEQAAKQGVDAETIRYIKDAGGVRTGYEKAIKEASLLRGEFDIEIKELEALSKEKISSQNSFDQQAVTTSLSARGSKLRLLKKLVAVVADVLTVVCVATSLCS